MNLNIELPDGVLPSAIKITIEGREFHLVEDEEQFSDAYAARVAKANAEANRTYYEQHPGDFEKLVQSMEDKK